MNIKEADSSYIAHTYGRFPVVLDHGVGCYVYDENHKEYLDMTAGIGVNSLGYGDSQWVEAVTKQATKLAHVSNLYYTLPATEVAQQLCKRTGFKKVCFANSGAEANEAAIKLARKYAYDKYGTGRNEIITLVNSFHGRTITTLSATGQDHFHQYFDPFTPGFVYAQANDFTDVLSNVSDKTCAIMMEVIQGEGGVLPLDKEFIKQVAMLCEQRDILLLMDEVQTGIGRCGTLFAYEQMNVKPDIVSVAKGLGNGLPIGAVLMNEKCENTFQPGDHGTTFGGNPIACAGANVVLTKIDEEFLQEVTEKGNYLKEQVSTLPHVIDVRGCGLMLGISLEKGIQASDVVKACIDKGLLLLTAKDKVRALPPLIITKEEIDKGIQILREVLTSGRQEK